MNAVIRRALMLAAIITVASSAFAEAQGVIPQSAAARTPRDTAKIAVIRQLLQQMHAVDMAVTAMDTQLPAQRAANPRIPPVFWDRFIKLAHDRVGELENVYVDIYDKYFTTDEIRQLIAFYNTPVGRKLLDRQPLILKESMLAGQQWGQKIGAEVGQQLEAEGVKLQP